MYNTDITFFLHLMKYKNSEIVTNDKPSSLQVISTGKYRFNELKRSGALQHLASSRANTNVVTLSDVRPVCLFSQSALCVLADDAKLPKKIIQLINLCTSNLM